MERYMKLTEKYLEMLPVKHCNFVKCDEMITAQDLHTWFLVPSCTGLCVFLQTKHLSDLQHRQESDHQAALKVQGKLCMIYLFTDIIQRV